jgi:hypothetical protein
MMTEDTEAAPLWRFVPLADYGRPPEPAREKMRRGLWGVWGRLRRKGGAPRPAPPPDLKLVPGGGLDQAVALPDWQEAVPALDEVLQDWLKSGRETGPLKVVVGAPHSGAGEIVARWAAARNWRVIEPPGTRQLLAGEGDRLRELDLSDEAPWLVPALEKWYLRHFNGLDPVRQFLDLLASRRQLTLVCCDTWAWAYLNQTVHLDLVLPSPLIPAAFDRERLSRWFQTLTRLKDGRPAHFRQLDSGKFVLPPAAAATTGGQPEMSNYLNRLAAYSRGIPGVAWAVWRRSLSLAETEDQEEADPYARTIWVRPWEELDLPGVPERHRGRLAFVLHTLLLHGGVATRLLPELLPNLGQQIRQDLHELRVAGVAAQEHDVWRVTALGYLAVREFLENESYLVDAV